MKLLYNVLINLAVKVLPLLQGLQPKLRKMLRGRKGIWERLHHFRNSNPGKLAWFHVASLGEYEQAKPVIAKLREEVPDIHVLLTFFSPSGYEVAIRKPQTGISHIDYLPWDTKKNAGQMVDLIQPDLVFFVKYDIWPNQLLALREKAVSTFLIAAAFRENQIYFQSYGGFFRQALFSFSHIFCQQEGTAALLRNQGYAQVSVTGDTRYDRVSVIAASPREFPELSDFVHGKKIIVAGSVWEEDMQILLPFIRSNKEYSWIIAPHDIYPDQLEKWSKQTNRQHSLYSKGASKDTEVLFIDNVGMLSSLYQFAHIAYVGGAFGRGLHNILEPLAYEIPVCFGELRRPGKFPEAAISVDYGCGFSVGTPEDFAEKIEKLAEPSHYLSACKAAGKLLKENLGSASKIISEVMGSIKTS